MSFRLFYESGSSVDVSNDHNFELQLEFLFKIISNHMPSNMPADKIRRAGNKNETEKKGRLGGAIAMCVAA